VADIWEVDTATEPTLRAPTQISKVAKQALDPPNPTPSSLPPGAKGHSLESTIGSISKMGG
jgi:hypothetical protein